MTRPIPSAAVNLVKEFEGCCLTAYQDVAGIWTIGYGSTDSVVEGMTITQEEADIRLANGLALAAQVVDTWVKVPLTDNQFAALVDFVFNEGANRFRLSTLLGVINKRAMAQVPQELMRWVYGGGRVLDGLIRRRQAECDLWNTP
jgi:lysozyme